LSEWGSLHITQVASLANGEADWWENPPADVWPVLGANANADITLAQTDPLGATRCLRFNHLQPPFD